MDEALEKMKRKLKRDLKEGMVDLKNTRKGGVVKMKDTDSCINIADDDTLIVRLSTKSPKTAYLIMGFLLQIIHKDSHHVMEELLRKYEKECDKDEEEAEDDDEEESMLPLMIDKETASMKIKEAIEGLNLKDGEEPKSICQIMEIPIDEEFDEEMFDMLPDFPDIRNVKVVIRRS